MITLRDVMTPDPISISLASTVREAVELLEGATIRHLPVTDGDRVVGMLSDRSLRPWRQAVMDLREGAGSLAAQEVLDRPVEALMTGEVLFLEADRPVTDAIDVMLDFRVGAVPVLEQGKLAGIVSYVDLLELLKKQLATA